jgi:hypothetical protein
MVGRSFGLSATRLSATRLAGTRLAGTKLAAASASLLALVLPGFAHADATRISGPVVHENLAVYFVHGLSAAGRVPLTLQEALAKGIVRVNETGQVNELAIENLGNEDVFVQSGDIVKGGRQDRVLMVSLILPPRSGVIPIASFCVEHGRWTARGTEDAKTFASSDSAVPSKEARLAMRAPVQPAAPPSTDPVGGLRHHSGPNQTADRQGRIWDSVASTQTKLKRALAAPVAAPASATSLQLSLENEKLKDAQAAYIKALKGEGERDDDIVGYMFAVNGKLAGADLYPSNGLFRKMWAKLLAANVTEAIAEKDAGAGTPPPAESVQAFLDAARNGTVAKRNLNAGVELETRDSDGAVYSETRRTDGGWVNRNFVAK